MDVKLHHVRPLFVSSVVDVLYVKTSIKKYPDTTRIANPYIYET